MSKRTELLSDLARQALAQYDADIKAGGEPIYPLWAKELQDVLASRDRLVDALRIAEQSVGDMASLQIVRSALATAEAA